MQVIFLLVLLQITTELKSNKFRVRKLKFQPLVLFIIHLFID